ncbi:GRIP and coiled-coil domain-containing protein 2-like [Cydia pomonella]|uniref:GRIP and coiled-coil domain-containing protein 2-like n=1 Tax=Cydia pomonella TaxID=82600 RepID=UPI002ADE42BE|nr:GRIP and coiled-coil domain-containing protein 2-like [Cydia pomonella]
MEGPGMSLFQGAASIHINNSAQDRLEEQEEIEDQKRRNEELKHKLANAFDDLQDDDEASSVNSSGNFTLDAQTNGANGHPNRLRTGLPPSYVDSLNHLKELQHARDSPNIHETPKNRHTPVQHHEDPVKLQFSPYGAGDGQNHYYQQEYRGHLNGINNIDAKQEYMNNEKLKVMYEMREKECQQLAAQMEKLDTEIDSLRARLAAAVNDRDKSELSLQEAHHLLASSKHKMIELEQQVVSLTEKLVLSEQEKEQMQMELRAANVSLQEVQQRLHTFQVAHTHDTDALFREQQDRHREEVDRLHADLTKAKSRLEEKASEINILEKRCLEKDKEKEELLIDKGATINRLASELEAAQNRLVNGETARLKEKVAQLSSERNAAREQVKELGTKLEVTAHELVLCRNKLAASQKEYESWRTALHQIMVDSLPENTYLGEPPSPGKLSTLKDALSRYKQQIHKVSALQEEIAKRDKKLEQHRKQESEMRAKIEEQKGLELQLSSRIAVLQSQLESLGTGDDKLSERLQGELDHVRAQLRDMELKYAELELEHDKVKESRGGRASLAAAANADLLRELERCSAQLRSAVSDNTELKTLYLQACSTRDSATRELKDVQSRIQQERDLYKSQEKEYVERIEKERQQLEKLTAELTSSKDELELANKRISELQKEFTDKQKEFTDKLNKYLDDEKTAMRKEMEPCPQCEKNLMQIRQLNEQLSKCSVKLATQESNEALMQELKGKAEFFQQYILERFNKLRDQRSVATNTDLSDNSIEHMVQTCDEAIATKTALMMKEKAIRDQIAEKFTLEMKTVEMNCARRLKEMENEQIATVTKLKELLERKMQEVETLKQFILTERAKVSQILESKENEISVLIKEHNAIQAECEKTRDILNEWKVKAEKYEKKIQRLDILKQEKEELEHSHSSCEKELRNVKSKINSLQRKVATSEQCFESLQAEHRTLLEKYKNAKKSIMTHREYISKKDAHINNEFNRIQDEYRKIFLKMQSQITYLSNCRVQEEKTNGRPATPTNHYEFAEKINKLTKEFAELTQSTAAMTSSYPDLNK